MEINIAREIAKAGLERGALTIDPEHPFEWASGYHMPIYNDTRLLLFSPKHREMIVDGLVQIVLQEGIEPDAIVGVAKGGIAHAYGLATRLNLPMAYTNGSKKEHGLRKIIEGPSGLIGQRVVIIEDVVSTGESTAKVVKAVRNASGKVSHCLSIFNYDFADDLFKRINCNLYSILHYQTLIEVAVEGGYLNTSQLKLLEEWRQDPFGWWRGQ